MYSIVVVYVGVVLLIIWVGIGIYNKNKKQKKINAVLKKAQDLFDDFLITVKHSVLKGDYCMADTVWFSYVEKSLTEKMDNFSLHFLEDDDEVLERYTEVYNELENSIKIYYNELNTLRKVILENEDRWFTDEINMPFFFVLTPIDNISYEIYCYSHNLRFKDEYKYDLVGYIFTSDTKYGYVKYISPKDYLIRSMTKDEFEVYLLGRLNVSDFTDIRVSIEYEKFLRDKFNTNNII